VNFRRKSITFPIAVALVSVTTLVLGALALFSYRSESDKERTRLRVQNEIRADQLALSLALPVWNFDRAQIDKIIESAMEDKEVFCVAVRLNDVNSTVHARVRDEHWNARPGGRDPKKDGLLVETRNIVANRESIGTVEVFATRRFMEANVRQGLLRDIFNILIAEMLLFAGLYFLLWRLVVKPIRSLEQYANSAGEGLKPHGPFTGELENLRDSLDQMLDMLKARYGHLRESEERYRTVVEFSPECLAIWVEDRLVYINPAGARLLGARSESLLGHSLYEFLPTRLHDEVRNRRELLSKQGVIPPPIEGEIIRVDGSTARVEAFAVPFTFDGASAVLNLVRDVTERKRAEAEKSHALQREQEALEDYAHKLIASQEVERRRIAGELHDSLGQNLLLIKNHVQQSLMSSALAEPLREQLSSVNQLVSQAIAEVRHISHDLRPYQLDQLGLTRSLEAMIDAAGQSSGISFERKLDSCDDVLIAEAATNFYRIVQECLNNILKHAGARHVKIRLEHDIDHVRLVISDDGRGFVAPSGISRRTSGGLGLRNMAERVRILGGTLKFNSAPGRGTNIEVLVPIRA
jgi:PAS domain S-box-containing protein